MSSPSVRGTSHPAKACDFSPPTHLLHSRGLFPLIQLNHSCSALSISLYPRYTCLIDPSDRQLKTLSSSILIYDNPLTGAMALSIPLEFSSYEAAVAITPGDLQKGLSSDILYKMAC